MLTLFALLAAFLGPGLILADNSGGGPVRAPVVEVAAPAAPAAPSDTVAADPVPVDDNSGGGPVKLH
jgi:hypothetical protein